MSWIVPIAKVAAPALLPTLFGSSSSKKSARDAVVGTPGQAASIVDATPEEYMGLRGDIAKQLKSIMEGGGSTQYQGQQIAPMAKGEQQMLGMLNSFALGNHPSLDAATGHVANVIAGESGSGSPVLGDNNLRRGTDLISQILSGATMNPETDKILEGVISAAMRPTERRFEDEMRDMRGKFTAAGQYIGPNASSPFEYAKQRLQGDLATVLGDTSATIMGNNLANERTRQTQLLNIQNSAAQDEADRRLRAAEVAPQIEKTKLEGIISAMNANALPRLIEQLGLTSGKETFDAQQKNLMDVLRMAIDAASGHPTSLPGQAGTTGIVGGVVESAGQSVIDAILNGAMNPAPATPAPVPVPAPVYESAPSYTRS